MKTEKSKLEEQQGQSDIPVVSKRYFVIRKCNCGTSEDKTDILGLTTDEEYAKSRQNVFCGYEEVKMIP
jgi:hypothetical protein